MHEQPSQLCLSVQDVLSKHEAAAKQAEQESAQRLQQLEQRLQEQAKEQQAAAEARVAAAESRLTSATAQMAQLQAQAEEAKQDQAGLQQIQVRAALWQGVFARRCFCLLWPPELVKSHNMPALCSTTLR